MTLTVVNWAAIGINFFESESKQRRASPYLLFVRDYCPYLVEDQCVSAIRTVVETFLWRRTHRHWAGAGADSVSELIFRPVCDRRYCQKKHK